MAVFLADGLVAKLSLPPLLAFALERTVAVAVDAPGKEAALGAVVARVAHVATGTKQKMGSRDGFG